jgi:hypothetical protein
MHEENALPSLFLNQKKKKSKHFLDHPFQYEKPIKFLPFYIFSLKVENSVHLCIFPLLRPKKEFPNGKRKK